MKDGLHVPQNISDKVKEFGLNMKKKVVNNIHKNVLTNAIRVAGN
jgi:hypothetical protein